MTNDEIMREIERLTREVNMLKGSNLANMGAQSVLSGDVQMLGQTSIRIPIIYALSTGSNPTDADACGVFMNAFGETFDGSTYYQLGGVNNGGLMFGLRSTDGAALFMGGQGSIDNTGINTRGIAYGLRQYAVDPTDSTTTRYFRLEMLLPDGRTQPAGSLTFTTGDETNLITNGDAETGDLTAWTQSGTLWSSDSTEYHGGAYSFKLDNNTGSAETLTSDRYAASSNKIYSISAWMKDYHEVITSELTASGDTLDSSATTTNFNGCRAGYYYYGGSGSKHHALVDYDYSSIPSNYYAISSSKIEVVPNAYNSGSQTYSAYRSLRNWVDGESTWNVYSTGNNWGTAGAENTSTDRESSNIGSLTTSSLGKQYINLTISKIVEMINGTFTDYGLVIRGTTESGTAMKSISVGPQIITYSEASKYTVYIKWYDDASAGSLIRTDTLWVENNTNSWNERTATVTAPAGALSYEIVISGGTGREFWVDDIVVAEQTFANKLLFLPELSYQDSDSTRRILSAKKELYAPQAPVIALVATASGNCTNGAHLCKVTFTDSSGETEASSASNSVTVDASNKQITCSLEVGPWGTTARNIYMTEAGGSTYKLVGTQADNTTTSYTINVPDGNLTTDAPMVNLSGSRNIYPGSFIVPCAGATSNATTSISYSSGNGLPAITQAGGAFANNGDWFLFPEISCMSGTYTIILFGIKGSDRGKVDLYLDNTLISSGHDLYNAGPIDGSFTTTGVTISGSGVHVFKAVVNGKNGSSTDYLTPMNSIIGRRTGD